MYSGLFGYFLTNFSISKEASSKSTSPLFEKRNIINAWSNIISQSHMIFIFFFQNTSELESILMGLNFTKYPRSEYSMFGIPTKIKR